MTNTNTVLRARVVVLQVFGTEVMVFVAKSFEGPIKCEGILFSHSNVMCE